MTFYDTAGFNFRPVQIEISQLLDGLPLKSASTFMFQRG